jgi:hypothetical protein
MRGAWCAAREEDRMTDYVVLFQGGGGMPEGEAAQKASMDAWTGWFTELGAAVKDPGNPFSGQAKTIASDGSVTDGSGGGDASGYTIIKADSLDAATTLAKSCPILAAGGALMVFETFDIM